MKNPLPFLKVAIQYLKPLSIPITVLLLLWVVTLIPVSAQQSYFFPDAGSFDPNIPSPEEFLGYAIGSHHSRHDRIIAYLEHLTKLSDQASMIQTGETYEHRPLVIFTVASSENHAQMESIRQQQLERCDPSSDAMHEDLPVIINLGYNVHGNEASSSEAAMLTAYYLVANQSEQAKRFREQAIVHFDPCINPDGRDRHSHWVNMHKGNPLVSDPLDREHRERWPSGRTNHYWFDLNRDWLLAVQPESKAKLNWYHSWYPNVVTDFHEMGTNSSYFFEPMKTNGAKNPIMPKENYTTLNEKFAEYFAEALDNIGSLYFSKERFDGTYPGYGSSYPDLQGGLGLLFEQASSRGHLQQSNMGELSFAFTIRNQLTSSLATLRASVENRAMLFSYQKDFFRTALSNARKDQLKAYVFGDAADASRNRAFIDLLLRHQIACYQLGAEVSIGGQTFKPGSAWVVPTEQVQYRMVQTMFETYTDYTDSVFYDASAWSPVHFYNIPYAGSKGNVQRGSQMSRENNTVKLPWVAKSSYAYLMDWRDYYAPRALNHLQQAGVITTVAHKPFASKERSYGYGTIMIPVAKQSMSADELHEIVQAASTKSQVPIESVSTGYNVSGVDLGSRYLSVLKAPKALMLLGRSVSSYEAGEVWHLMDTRVGMPITKVDMANFGRVNLADYNVMILVSGNYGDLGSGGIEKIKNWVSAGGTLITERRASAWVINQGLVKEKLVENEEKNDSTTERIDYVQATEVNGSQATGGTIFEVDLDLTHPLGFGYTRRKLPIYRNSNIMLQASSNRFSTVAQYTANPLISGFVSDKNLEKISHSAALLVSSVGRGRVVMFSDNPNFRGAWYGTNKLFLNAVFLGQHIRVP